MAFIVPFLAAIGGGSAMTGGAMLASVAATGMSAVSQVQQGKYQAAVEKEDARSAEFQARDSLQRGVIEEDKHRLQIRRMLGTQLSRFGASGVSSGTGSPLTVLADTAQLGEADALTIRNNAAREAWGYREQAKSLRSKAKMTSRSSTQAGIGSLLSGAASAYGTWKGR